jgi:hypothetical protein
MIRVQISLETLRKEKEKMDEYIPELGQAIFGQPYKKYSASDLFIAALQCLRDRLEMNIFYNYTSPFGNYGNSFKCDTFEVEAYSWDENYDQPYNFKYKDIEVSWYKYLGRGTTINRKVSNDEIAGMLTDCLKAIDKYEEEMNDAG